LEKKERERELRSSATEMLIMPLTSS
jgi:hypothetical protein